MSARTKLLALMGANKRLAEQVADEILGDHAHELAEEIRAFATHPGRLQLDTEDEIQARLDMADLIDPEREK